MLDVDQGWKLTGSLHIGPHKENDLLAEELLPYVHFLLASLNLSGGCSEGPLGIWQLSRDFKLVP